MPFGRISEQIRGVLRGENLIYTVTPMSIYQPDENRKNLSFHLKFASSEHTLDSAEITQIMDKITVETTKIGAELV